MKVPILKTVVALVLASASASCAEQLDHTCCSALSQNEALGPKVVVAGSAAYDARLKTYYSANAAQHAWCMVLPHNTGDVQILARIISKLQCPFGIRAGAHSAWTGSNGIKEGVTIDFGHMNTTRYDEKAETVSIQPGARWGPVYDTLNRYNRVAVGARASVVGVGGFTTGGGYSFHANSHGFSCDAVQNWEIVLANGSVVNANAREHADLWKAQKGGSGNFGFVTRIDQETVKGSHIWGGFTSYNVAETDRVFQAYLDFVDQTEESSADQAIVALFYDATGFSIRSILTNNKGTANSQSFDTFLKVPNISSTITTGAIADIIPQFTGPTPLGLYANWFTGTASNNMESLHLIERLHREYARKMQNAAPSANFSTLIEFQPVTKTMVENSNRRGGNVLGLERVVRDGPVLMWLLALTVDTAKNQAVILPIAREFIKVVNDKLRAKQGYVDWVYLNYAWKDQSPFSHFGSENLGLMTRVSSAYDPHGVFQTLRRSGYTLHDA